MQSKRKVPICVFILGVMLNIFVSRLGHLGFGESAGRQETQIFLHVEGGQSRPLLCVVLILLLQGLLCGTEPYANATRLGREANAPRSCLMYIINKCVFRDRDSYRLN